MIIRAFIFKKAAMHVRLNEPLRVLIWHSLFTPHSLHNICGNGFIMERKDQQKSRVDRLDDDIASSGPERQEANAGGKDNNDQGQASFVTGSTTGGGSDYGQGSAYLGAESYRQGDTANTGSNYDNEAENLGSSNIGTGDEGSFSPRLNQEDRVRNADKDERLQEANRRDTRLEGNDFSTGNQEQNDS